MPRTRPPDSLRPIAIQAPFLDSTPASVLYSSGRTRVLCVATLAQEVPAFLEGRGSGWATAEYDLLPGSTTPRKPRERSGKLSGRTQEIQRLIGRCLRGVLDLEALDGWTLRADCDVLQADGGTRTAAICGTYVAARLACDRAVRDSKIQASPLRTSMAAISVGTVDGVHLLDLDYSEDSAAEVDLNVVMTGSGEYLEVQGTSEGKPFSHDDLDRLLALARKGIGEIGVVQQEKLREISASQ